MDACRGVGVGVGGCMLSVCTPSHRAKPKSKNNIKTYRGEMLLLCAAFHALGSGVGATWEVRMGGCCQCALYSRNVG